jgi:hypothetical protein
MTSEARIKLAEMLIGCTRAARIKGLDSTHGDGEVYMDASDGTEVIVHWSSEHQAYGAIWTCGAVSAHDVARVVGRGER